MKKVWKIVVIVMAFLCITGCNKNNEDLIAENVQKIALTGDLVTYEAYYHNVVEYEQERGTGITHILEKDRKYCTVYCSGSTTVTTFDYLITQSDRMQ